MCEDQYLLRGLRKWSPNRCVSCLCLAVPGLCDQRYVGATSTRSGFFHLKRVE